MSDLDKSVTDGPQTSWHDALRLLREEASNLIKTIPGPVASMSLRLADCALEVSWAATPPAGLAPTAGSAGSEPLAAGADPSLRDPRLQEVVTPMVGTFYRAPEPGAAPFVQVGDRVEAGQTVGIVEAMKLMNPVPAQQSGAVVAVLVSDGEPVEYGQGLVRILVDAP